MSYKNIPDVNDTSSKEDPMSSTKPNLKHKALQQGFKLEMPVIDIWDVTVGCTERDACTEVVAEVGY